MSQYRLRAKNGEKIPRCLRNVCPDYAASATKVHVDILEGRGVCKILTVVPPIVKLLRSVSRRYEIPQQDKAAWFAKRQGAQQQCVHYAKCSRIGADAESKREDRDGGEARRFAQSAQAVADVLQDRIEPCADAGFAHAFFYLLGTAESEPCRAISVLWCSALADLLLRQHVHVESNFIVEIALLRRALDEATEKTPNARKQRHGRLLFREASFRTLRVRERWRRTFVPSVSIRRRIAYGRPPSGDKTWRGDYFPIRSRTMQSSLRPPCGAGRDKASLLRRATLRGRLDECAAQCRTRATAQVRAL